MRQNSHGNCWLWAIMVVQVAYILVYLGIDFAVNYAGETRSDYKYFIMILLIWFMAFCLFFLRNSTLRFLLEEFKINLVTLAIMNIYTFIKYTVSAV